ncbi:hypothetical protein AAVH_23394 [Aphelenchoides avenae]|nr:hypothetical protein AAVH_23394 [Aphelenchus avenae]
MWAGNSRMHMSCNGESATLAFRICRRSCGFCDLELYQDKNKSDKCPRGGHRRKGNETSTARPDEFIGGAETWTSESPMGVEGNITEFPAEIELTELPPELVAELEKELEKEEKELEKEEEEIEPKEEENIGELEKVEEVKPEDNVEI